MRFEARQSQVATSPNLAVSSSNRVCLPMNILYHASHRALWLTFSGNSSSADQMDIWFHEDNYIKKLYKNAVKSICPTIASCSASGYLNARSYHQRQTPEYTVLRSISQGFCVGGSHCDPNSTIRLKAPALHVVFN